MDKNLPDWEKKWFHCQLNENIYLPPALDIVLDAMGMGIVGRYQEAWEIFFPVLEELLSFNLMKTDWS